MGVLGLRSGCVKFEEMGVLGLSFFSEEQYY